MEDGGKALQKSSPPSRVPHKPIFLRMIPLQALYLTRAQFVFNLKNFLFPVPLQSGSTPDQPNVIRHFAAAPGHIRAVLIAFLGIQYAIATTRARELSSFKTSFATRMKDEKQAYNTSEQRSCRSIILLKRQ